MNRYEYLRDPDAIARRSFAAIREAVPLDHLPPPLARLTARLIHACGMTDLPADLAWSPDVATAAGAALAAGAPVLVDAEMVAHGVTRRRLPAANRVICRLNDPQVPARAKAAAITRSAAAVELWGNELAGAVVAIGNAPTALFRLLELIQAGAPRPAAILGFPVGFVGAAEAKEALIELAPCAYVTLRGRRGGSALAAAAVNALACPEEVQP